MSSAVNLVRKIVPDPGKFESVAVELSRAVGDNAKKFDNVVDNVVAITADARIHGGISSAFSRYSMDARATYAMQRTSSVITKRMCRVVLRSRAPWVVCRVLDT